MQREGEPFERDCTGRTGIHQPGAVLGQHLHHALAVLPIARTLRLVPRQQPVPDHDRLILLVLVTAQSSAAAGHLLIGREAVLALLRPGALAAVLDRLELFRGEGSCLDMVPLPTPVHSKKVTPQKKRGGGLVMARTAGCGRGSSPSSAA